MITFSNNRVLSKKANIWPVRKRFCNIANNHHHHVASSCHHHLNEVMTETVSVNKMLNYNCMDYINIQVQMYVW